MRWWGNKTPKIYVALNVTTFLSTRSQDKARDLFCFCKSDAVGQNVPFLFKGPTTMSPLYLLP